jgi:hypothetical protein
VHAADKVWRVRLGGLGIKTATLYVLVLTCALHVKRGKNTRRIRDDSPRLLDGKPSSDGNNRNKPHHAAMGFDLLKLM